MAASRPAAAELVQSKASAATPTSDAMPVQWIRGAGAAQVQSTQLAAEKTMQAQDTIPIIAGS